MLKKKKKIWSEEKCRGGYCDSNLLSKLLDWQYWNAGKARQYSSCVENSLSFFYNNTYSSFILKHYLGKRHFIIPMDRQWNFLLLEKWKYVFLLLQLTLSELLGVEEVNHILQFYLDFSSMYQ